MAKPLYGVNLLVANSIADMLVLTTADPDATLVDVFGLKSKPADDYIEQLSSIAGTIGTQPEPMISEQELMDIVMSVSPVGATTKSVKAGKSILDRIIKLYRGVDKWHPKQMVKEGKYVGGGKYIHKRLDPESSRWVTENPSLAKEFKKSAIQRKYELPPDLSKKGEGVVLEFEVPESYLVNKFNLSGGKLKDIYTEKYLKDFFKTRKTRALTGYFPEGLPKKYLKKVHK